MCERLMALELIIIYKDEPPSMTCMRTYGEKGSIDSYLFSIWLAALWVVRLKFCSSKALTSNTYLEGKIKSEMVAK